MVSISFLFFNPAHNSLIPFPVQRDPVGAIDQILFDFSKQVPAVAVNGRPSATTNTQNESKLLLKRLKLKGCKCTM